MRERFRDKWSSFPSYAYPIGLPEYREDYLTDRQVIQERISDQNNFKKGARPDGPCYHSRANYAPESVLRRLESQGMMVYGPTFKDASIIELLVSALSNSLASASANKMLRDFYDHEVAAFERFDAINAVIGLADCGDYFKSLSKYRYLDWEFGLAPTMADAMEAYRRVHETIQSVNARIDGLTKAPVHFSQRRIIPVEFHDVVSLLVGDPSDISIDGQTTVRLKGTVRVQTQRLTQFDRDWYIWMDKVGIHPDIAALWEAIPFSWLVDWFVPIGSALEQFSGNWFNPTAHFSGSVSYKTIAGVELIRPTNVQLYGPLGALLGERFDAGKPEGSGIVKVYNRTAFSMSKDSREIPGFSASVPVPDPRKCGILTDVAGIDYVKWATTRPPRKIGKPRK